MLAHFFAGCLVAFAAVPDIIPRGYKHISVTLQFAAQPLVDHCCTQHVITKGETLSKIATTRLGSVKATKDIIALNPGIKPSLLKIGQRIWLPPKLESARQLPKTFVFYAANWPLDAGGQPFAALETGQPPRYGKLALLFVPEKHLATFNKSRRDWRAMKELTAKKTIEKLEISGRGSNIRDTNPTHKRTDTVTIKRDEKGKFSASISSVGYDKKGNVVSGEGLKKIGGKQGMWLLLLPAAGAAFLLLRTRHRPVPVLA